MKIIKNTNARIAADIRKGLFHLTITHDCGKNWQGGTEYRGGGINDPDGFVDCINFDCKQSHNDGGYFWICAETEEEKNKIDGMWYHSQNKNQEFFICVPWMTRDEVINFQTIAEA